MKLITSGTVEEAREGGAGRRRRRVRRLYPRRGGGCAAVRALRAQEDLGGRGGNSAGRKRTSLRGAAPTGKEVIGEALDRALAEARVPPSRLSAIAHDLSGRYSQFEELSLAAARPPFTKMASPRTVQVSITAGETGAAAGALSLAALRLFSPRGGREGIGGGPVQR